MKKIIFLLFLISIILINGCATFPKACTLEARLCSDGSTVGRNPNNNCEFDPCPTTNLFNIYYSFGVGEKNVLDTKNNIYIKDMVCDPPKQYQVVLSDIERSEIYGAVFGNDLLNIKEDLTENCNPLGLCKNTTPLSTSTLKIEYGGKTKIIKWSSNYFYDDDLDFKKIMSFEKIIRDNIISKKEQKMNVEQPRCGYL